MDEALKIARQIADALDAAHEKGIVHRDLKPANIKITPSGTVKVLDFGLAKVAAGNGAASQAPTVTVDGTREGMILGTAAYMSPEQARGQAVDKRTDIWAFGCVLYEMLTGRTAFAGETISDTIAAILGRQPDWTALPAVVPSVVRSLLERCLDKEPKRRVRDIGDVGLYLESTHADRIQPLGVGAPRGRRGYLWRAAAAVGLVAVGVGAGALWKGVALEPPSGLSIGPVTRLTSDSGLTTEPGISADGRLIAYASNRSGEGNLDIWVQQASGGSAIRLTSDQADDREPNISPDGSLIAFRSERSPRGIYVIPALGGDARLIAPDGMAPRFSPDGRSIAFWTGGWLAPRGVRQVRRTFIVPAGGGDPVQVASSLASVGDPVWSPDGKAVLVFGRQATSGKQTDPDWWWVPLDGGAVVRSGVYERFKAAGLENMLTDLYPYPSAWTSDGVLFSAADAGEAGFGEADSRSVWRIAVDFQTGRVTGEPVRLTRGTTTDTSPSVSRDGRLVFAAGTEHDLFFALPLDVNAGRPTGPLRRVRGDTAGTGRPGVSEDGRLLVFPRYEFAAGGVWIHDLRTGRERQLAATPRVPLNPVISVDGRWVGYTVTTVELGGQAGPGTGYVVETSGGAPRRVCDDCQIYEWSRDNTQLYVVDKGAILTRLDRASGSRSPVVRAFAAATGVDGDGVQIDRPLLSPNERWLVFNSRRKVFVAPLYPDRADTGRRVAHGALEHRGRAVGGPISGRRAPVSASRARRVSVPVRAASRSGERTPNGGAVPCSSLPRCFSSLGLDRLRQRDRYRDVSGGAARGQQQHLDDHYRIELSSSTREI